jgi:hypothetical protein
MGSSGGIMQAIYSILEALGVHPPPWAGPVFGLTMMAILMPFILRNFKIGRARKLLQRSRVFQPREREQAGREALSVVRRVPMGLVAVADEAIRQERLGLAREATRRLIATGKSRDHARRLVRTLELDGGPHSAEELMLSLERLESAGLEAEARARLAKGLQRWPEDVRLRSWQDRLDGGGPTVATSESHD